MNVHWLGDKLEKTLAMTLGAAALALLLGPCSPRQMIVGGLADELASHGGATKTISICCVTPLPSI